MSEPTPRTESHDDVDSAAPPGTPRWVKVFGVVTVVLVLLVSVLLLTGAGGHGPGRHAPSGDAAGPAPPSAIDESGGLGGHRPPAGGHAP